MGDCQSEEPLGRLSLPMIGLPTFLQLLCLASQTLLLGENKLFMIKVGFTKVYNKML